VLYRGADKSLDRPGRKQAKATEDFDFYVHGTVHLSNTIFLKYQRDATYSVYLVYFLQLYMFRTQSASIFRSNFLQTVVAATGVCYRYGVDKSRIGVIGSVCIIPGSIDVDGLAMLLVSNGESSFYVLRGGIPFWRSPCA